VRGQNGKLMSVIEKIPQLPILIPSDYVILDNKTLLVHQGAMLVRPEPRTTAGRVIGYTVLCTDVLRTMWSGKPRSALPGDTPVSCFKCLGAREQ
jgi:hypothetical protein